MAPVIRLELNGFQYLLSHDDAIEDLKIMAWMYSLRNLRVIIFRWKKPFSNTCKPLMVAELKLVISSISRHRQHSFYVVHPHPGATSTNSSSLLSLVNWLQAQSHQNPYSTQDKRSSHLARSLFLALQH
jgi:hypothetical protein